MADIKIISLNMDVIHTVVINDNGMEGSKIDYTYAELKKLIPTWGNYRQGFPSPKRVEELEMCVILMEHLSKVGDNREFYSVYSSDDSLAGVAAKPQPQFEIERDAMKLDDAAIDVALEAAINGERNANDKTFIDYIKQMMAEAFGLIGENIILDAEFTEMPKESVEEHVCYDCEVAELTYEELVTYHQRSIVDVPPRAALVLKGMGHSDEVIQKMLDNWVAVQNAMFAYDTDILAAENT